MVPVVHLRGRLCAQLTLNYRFHIVTQTGGELGGFHFAPLFARVHKNCTGLFKGGWLTFVQRGTNSFSIGVVFHAVSILFIINLKENHRV